MSLPQTPSFSLHGKHALVAGGTSGIGLGCAVACAQAGADTTICARDGDKIAKTVEAIRAQGYAVHGCVLDIADTQAIEQVLAEQPIFDILVNSAGMARHSPALDTQSGDFDAVVATNFRGAYFLCQTVAKNLIEAKKPGSLITVSSQMAHVGGVDRAVYCGSKHAVEG
ncbi:MAG: SDR family NAD(P)-dependent oxidoreductase, partial [Pseudomonadota bacterium]